MASPNLTHNHQVVDLLNLPGTGLHCQRHSLIRFNGLGLHVQAGLVDQGAAFVSTRLGKQLTQVGSGLPSFTRTRTQVVILSLGVVGTNVFLSKVDKGERVGFNGKHSHTLAKDEALWRQAESFELPDLLVHDCCLLLQNDV